MDGLRIGVAGTGFVGRIHARSARLAGARLVGVAASTPDSAARAAGELRAENAFASAEELVEADGIDVVHLCTPNHLHEPLALKALAAGRHVVCEKPVALDAYGARRIAEAAARAGRVVAVPFVYRFHPMAREARARVAAGELGRIRVLHGTYLQDWLLAAGDTNWRVDRTRGGPSRAFADIGSHWCDLVEFVSGTRLARLLAHTSTTVPARAAGARATFAGAGPGAGPGREAGERSELGGTAVTTEDVALVLFETDAGGTGSVVISQVAAGRKNRLWFELDGETASAAFDQENPDTLWIGRRSGTTLVARDAAHLAPDAARLATLPAGHGQGYHDCFDLFVADAYAAMADPSGPGPDGLPLIADGVRAAQITDAVVASARSQSWTEVRS
ncbi:MAG TPA: Gfo/Idh/MocA family oxidoreductase [Acidimicrobiales bacterium]|nr:Gfo/Idh/MocA family oxidoreductase [Acidimicrobiales bacterium]